METMHRTGNPTREPRESMQKRLLLAQMLNAKLEQQLDAAWAEVARLHGENEELRKRLARVADIDATCEALGL